MAEISVQLHSCLNTMKNLSREKRDDIIQNQQELVKLKKEYENLGKTITDKETALITATQELETLNVHIKETQQQYKKILDSTQALMKQVKEYNPSKGERAEVIIEQTLDDLKKSHQEIQMTNYTIAKNRQESDAQINQVDQVDQADQADHTIRGASYDNPQDVSGGETDKKDLNRCSSRLKHLKRVNRGRQQSQDDYPEEYHGAHATTDE